MWDSIELIGTSRHFRFSAILTSHLPMLSTQQRMKYLNSSRESRSRTPGILVVLLCVLLILFVGAAQALHIHAPDEVSNPGCSLCAVAHVSALPAPVLAAPVAVETVAAVAPPDAVAAPQRFYSFSLYVRPPPALTAHA